MGKGAGHRVIWEGKYITQGCAARAGSNLQTENAMPSSRRRLLLMSLLLLPGMLARGQDFPTQDKRGRRRPDGSEDQPTRTPRIFPAPAAKCCSKSVRKISRKRSKSFMTWRLS